MKTLYIIFFSLVISTAAFAQQNNILYFMDRVPQSMDFNPAVQNPRTVFVGLPALSSIYFNYTNNGFSYHNLIHKGEGAQEDSLIIDLDNFLDKSKAINTLSFETQIALFSLGLNIKDFYFSFGITEKIASNVSVPKGIFELLYYGNATDWSVDMSGFGLDATHYREYALGASYVIDDKWTVGIRPKLLFGKANVWTKNSTLIWDTDPENFYYDIQTEFDVYMSIPAGEITEFSYDKDSSNFNIESSESEDVEALDYVFNSQNTGFGIDLGGVYKLQEEITLYGSLTDLGWIKWKSGVSKLHETGRFKFNGVDMGSMFSSDTAESDVFEEAMDTLLSDFEVSSDNEPYSSYLTSKLYLGGKYQITEAINVGALVRSELFAKNFKTSLTLSCNTDFLDWLSASTSVSIANNTLRNIGLGLATKVGPIQFYIVNDNIIGMIWPHKTRNINLRFGLNILVGSLDKEKEVPEKSLLD